MSFDRTLLPDPVAYYEQQGLKLQGRGEWGTAGCVFHGGSDSTRINRKTGGGRCMACGKVFGDVLAYHMQLHELTFIEAAKDLGAWCDDGGKSPRAEPRKLPAEARNRAQDAPKHATLSEYGRELWRSTVPLPGTIADKYLTARCCALPPADGHLRYHPALRHPCGYSGPALVALITDAITREPISLHRTWINADGTKAAVTPERMLLKDHRKQGGVIRLWPDECVSYGLGIAEGIETALTLATVLKPVWALIDAPNLGEFPVLSGIEVLTISADNDTAGLEGARKCADRWAVAGCDVRMVIPPAAGADLNDVARAAA